jgi:dolichol-phosphate mannosyltransferase
MEGHAQDQGTGGRSLSLVIPAYNEAAGIGRAIAEADAALAGLAASYELLVVDDGSRDGTAQAVELAARGRPRVRLLRHHVNRGYGAALRTGFEAARFERVAFTDADCQFHLEDLASLLSLTDRYPLAAGYRQDRQDSWRRCFVSRGYNMLTRTLLGTRVRDCDCALKVFRKDALARLLPETDGFFVNAEILARARQLGYRVAETGVRHRPRLCGNSKVSLREVPRTLATLLPFWWSRVLLPEVGARSQGSGASEGPKAVASLTPALGLIAVVVVAALLLFSRIRGPLLEPDEARYAEIPRQMLQEGRLLIPVLHGQPYYQKPPLLYWLVMGAYSVFGVHDWAARLVPCGAAFLTVLVSYFWSRRTLGPRPALAGALMLCLSARFVHLGRMLNMDSLLCLCIVTAWAAAHWALAQKRGVRGQESEVREDTVAGSSLTPEPSRLTPILWHWWLLSALACGLGLLAKGPVALVLVAVPIMACQWLDQRFLQPRLLHWLAYLALACGLACPWYVAAMAADSASAADFWRHNLLRYLSPIDHGEPIWYYMPGFFLGMLPWTLLLPGLVRLLGRRSAAMAGQRPAGLGLPLLASLWCLTFFSLAGCKQPGYMLPAMPPLILALGWYLDRTLPRGTLRRLTAVQSRRRNLLPYQATVLVLALGVGLNLLAIAADLEKPGSGLVMAAGAALVLVWRLRRGPGRRPLLSWGLCGAATFVLLLAAVHLILPKYARKFSLRAEVEPLLSENPQLPVVCYPHRWDSVSFYLRRNDVRMYTAETRAQFIADLCKGPQTLVFVKSDIYYQDLLRSLPASLEFIPRGHNGIITAGIVCRRIEAPPSLLASR